MTDLDKLFNWTCTYSKHSEIREIHGKTQDFLQSDKLHKFDKFKVQLPGKDIQSIMQEKSRYIIKKKSRNLY